MASSKATKIRAKMVCSSVAPTGDTFTIRLSPVVSGSEENESFYKYTPGGLVALDVVNEETANHFVAGQEYYVDFTPAGAVKEKE